MAERVVETEPLAERSTSVTVPRIRWRQAQRINDVRHVPEEVAIAFSYAGSTHAVMMATPADLMDFALGFSLTEGIVSTIDDVDRIEVVHDDHGIDVQIWLRAEKGDALIARRRHMAGPVGCGLCGIESIDQAMRTAPPVQSTLHMSADHVAEAIAALNAQQPLHQITRAVHGAGFFMPGAGMVAVREDVGRHNALDKLAGALLASGHRGGDGAVVVSSRVSVEMVQKTALIGSGILIAISAPTALALRVAQDAGITVIALARGEDFEVFTHPKRIDFGQV